MVPAENYPDLKANMFDFPPMAEEFSRGIPSSADRGSFRFLTKGTGASLVIARQDRRMACQFWL